MSDRYVFAKGCDDPDCYECRRPAPDPADWQKVVEAADGWVEFSGRGWEEYEAVDAVLTAAEAAVRNMREAQNDGGDHPI